MSLHYLMQEKGNLIFVLNINEAKLILCRILRDANIWFELPVLTSAYWTPFTVILDFVRKFTNAVVLGVV